VLLWQVEALLTEGGLTLPFHLEPVDIELPELQDEPAVVSRSRGGERAALSSDQ
jgi:hypothetical protein